MGGGTATGGGDPTGGGGAAGGGGGTEPVAVLVPAPPSYWYVDALPLVRNVGGADVVAWRYRIDSGAWSAEAPVSTPLTVPAPVSPGRRVLELVGRNAAGVWQTTATSYAFQMATTQHADLACTVTAGGCDLVINPGTAEQYYAAPGLPKQAWETYWPATGDLAPGTTICLAAGAHGARYFRNYRGTPEAPIVITNCGGVATLTKGAGSGGSALGLPGVRHLRVVGTGSTAVERGLVLRGAVSGAHGVSFSEGASNFELAYVEVNGARNHGIDAKSDDGDRCVWNRANFVQRDTFIHHTWVHDVYDQGSGQGYECMYLGSSHWTSSTTIMCNGQPTSVQEHELHGVRVYDNLIERCGNEGIQIGCARYDVAVARNRVRDIGLHRDQDHSNGIQFGGGTTGLIEGNLVRGAGLGLSLSGPGDTTVINNVIGEIAGAAVQTRGADATDAGWYIINNTFFDVARNGCTWGSANMCYCNNRRALCHYDTTSTGSVYFNNLAPGTDSVTSAPRMQVGNNITSGTLDSHFVDAGAGDLRLKSTSSAIDAGRDVSAWGVTRDADGRARPVGGYDVGAYEFQP